MTGTEDILRNGIFYKYISTGAGQQPEWQDRVKNLLLGRCYLSSAADFNDPFDCLPYIDSPGGSDLVRWREGMISSLASVVGGDLPDA